MMIVDTIEALREVLNFERSSRHRVGLVPTMGALHAGHRSLLERARVETEVVVASVFVNPAQFGPSEDYLDYPRDLDSDSAQCRDARADVLFVPDVSQIYPREPLTRVHVEGLADRYEGSARPGHFDGVALVVAKLFNAAGACRAYFGQKDAQQLAVVRRMVQDLNQPVDVVACETVRDADGLALSSRNAYLSGEQRERALCLPRALFAMRDASDPDPRSLERLGAGMLDEADSTDYLACVDPETFEPAPSLPALAIGAIRVGRTRLIDNVMIEARS